MRGYILCARVRAGAKFIELGDVTVHVLVPSRLLMGAASPVSPPLLIEAMAAEPAGAGAVVKDGKRSRNEHSQESGMKLPELKATFSTVQDIMYTVWEEHWAQLRLVQR